MEHNMKIKLNEDKEIVKLLKEGLKNTGGYCPCSTLRTDDMKCICKEFREQQHSGNCHCGLYYKEIEK